MSSEEKPLRKQAKATTTTKLERSTNYCLKETKASYKCLSDNNYDREACKKYFDAYKECKREFNELKAQRRRQGLFPQPPPEVIEEKNKDLQ